MFGAQEPGRAGLGQRSRPAANEPLMSHRLTNTASTRPRPADGAEGTAPGRSSQPHGKLRARLCTHEHDGETRSVCRAEQLHGKHPAPCPPSPAPWSCPTDPRTHPGAQRGAPANPRELHPVLQKHRCLCFFKPPACSTEEQLLLSPKPFAFRALSPHTSPQTHRRDAPTPQSAETT